MEFALCNNWSELKILVEIVEFRNSCDLNLNQKLTFSVLETARKDLGMMPRYIDSSVGYSVDRSSLARMLRLFGSFYFVKFTLD